MEFAVTAVALTALLGYQEARGGSVVPVERFESPMVVELPIVLGRPGVSTSALSTPDERKRTRKFICDGVYVFDLTVKAGKPSRENDVDVTGKLTLSAEHGNDKRVDVLAEIIQGGEVLASSKIAPQTVEEDEQSTKDLAFHLTGSQLKDPSALKVRLTLEVETKK